MMMIDGGQTEGHVYVRCNHSVSSSQLTPNCSNVGCEGRMAFGIIPPPPPAAAHNLMPEAVT